MRQQQKGFTLVEIAIVLVIIGLLLGGILKGQELINSARVRNLADTTTGIQAAYFGFIDRFRRVPGDWNKTDAATAIGVAITGTGNDNGHIDDGNYVKILSLDRFLQRVQSAARKFGADFGLPHIIALQ